MDRTCNPKTHLTPEEIAAVRRLVVEHGVPATAKRLGLSGATVLRTLSGLPVHTMTAAHLRARLARDTLAQ